MLYTSSLLPKNYAKTIDENEGIVVERRDTSIASPKLVQSDLPLDEQEEIIMPTHKRKRPSINYSQLENVGPWGIPLDSPSTPDDRPPTKRAKKSKDTRGVMIGVWRDSDQPDDDDKHVIYGFIDIYDRLRTRIYAQNRRDEFLQANMPMGAGGCWVTFERIIFEKYLKTLNAAQIKEYVKLRENIPKDKTPGEEHATNTRLVIQAQQIVATQEANGSAPKMKTTKSAHRVQPTANKHLSAPHPASSHTPSSQAVNAAGSPTLTTSPDIEKPNGIVIGYWVDSDAAREADKHAVIGLISDAANNFRVKVQNNTRDGREVRGNFPTGLGAQWLHYEKVVLDSHLTGLSRPEVKEYVRVRIRQIMAGESPKERKSNESKAVQQAKNIVAVEAVATANGKISSERHSTRVEQRRQAEAEAEAAARREQEGIETSKSQAKSKKATPAAKFSAHPAAQEGLDYDMERLNKVWASKHTAPTLHMTPMHPTTSLAAPEHASPYVDETKYHEGIKYERKKTGPFEGKLCSAPQILNIDGEDYIEYKVLTKPSFF